MSDFVFYYVAGSTALSLFMFMIWTSKDLYNICLKTFFATQTFCGLMILAKQLGHLV